MDLVHAPIFVYALVIFLTKTDANKSTSPRTSNFFFLPMIFDHEVIIEFTQIANTCNCSNIEPTINYCTQHTSIMNK